jgi:membrane protease YdiL (CAAX protease family)
MSKQIPTRGKVHNIILYIALAFVISFVLARAVPVSIAQVFHDGLNVFSYGMGPALAVACMYAVSRIQNRPFKLNTLWGHDVWWKSILVYFVPIISMMGFAAINRSSVGSAFTIGLSIMLYCLGEEIGWRGWLLKNFDHYSLIKKALIMWPIWLLWHLSFQTPSQTFNVVFVLAILVGSYFIGLATIKTGSILVAASMHAVLNLIEYSPKSLAVTIPIWVLLFVFWKKVPTQMLAKNS